jgi:ABC-2 type transport system ATP-binding protein
MIEICNLTKSYGSKKALDDISFTVSKGEIVGFLGPNGAGKSTTMNILTGYISSTSGSVTIDGHDILDEPKKVKQCIGYLPEQPPLYQDMAVWDYLSFVYDLKKITNQEKQVHIRNVVDKVGIDNVKNRKIANLSKGYKQRVGLAQALLGDPEVLVLDEPTVGLDPKQIIEIRNMIEELGEEHTVILSSHILSEISAVCERVIIINQGKIVAEDTPEHLSEQFATKSKMQLRIAGEEEDIINTLKDIVGIQKIRRFGQKEEGSFDFEIETDSKIDTEFNKQLFFVFAEKGMPILMQKEEETTLEDIFLEATKDVGTASVEQHPEEDLTAETQEIPDAIEEGEKEGEQNDSNL